MATKTLTDSESMLISTVNAGGSTGYPVRMVKAKKRAAKLVTLGLIKIEGHALEMEGQRGFQDRWDLALAPDVVPDSAIAPDPEPASLRSAFKIVLDGIARAFHHEENIWFSATDGAVSARR